MKKFLLLISVFLLISGFAFAKIIAPPFEPKEFDVNIYQYPSMQKMENAKSEQIDTYYQFTNEKKDYEIRYSFFSQTEKDVKNIKNAFDFYLLMIIENIAGDESCIKNSTDFQDGDVKNEFNGDFGKTVFIQDCKSDYTQKYKYIMLNFYYKMNQGIVCQAILFNDMDIMKKDYYMDIFHSFRFHE